MRRRSSGLALLAGAALLAALAGLSFSAESRPAPKAAGSGADLYAVDPQPMTVAECGRCHTLHFGQLKKDGGRHRFDCRDCHQVFHAYNPRKANYAEIMPKCGECHGTPHGTKQVECLGCHVNPHAPVRAPAVAKLAGLCADCHVSPADQMKAAPSAHAKLACEVCHSERHGRVPVCSECHKPHFAAQAAPACLQCHPAHRPLETKFVADSDAKTCAACHDEVFQKWSKTPSRHGKVNCTTCHKAHRAVPQCTECHKAPHAANMMAKFSGCLGCHLDVHDPPTKGSR